MRQIAVTDIQALAADGYRYSMIISDSDQLVWIHKTGGIGNNINEFVGPWSINNPHANALQSEVLKSEATVKMTRSNEQ